MDIITIAILAVVAVVVLFLIVKFITGCLPKILLGIIIIGVVAYLAYRFFIQKG